MGMTPPPEASCEVKRDNITTTKINIVVAVLSTFHE